MSAKADKTEKKEVAAEKQSGAEFKQALKDGQCKMGIFVNSASPTVVGQLSHSGYDWLLVDTQHGPMDSPTLSAMLSAISNGKAKSLVRVGGYTDRIGIQQALDLGADGILVPYINNKKEAEESVSCCLYPTAGTRSVYFPQRATNEKGLLGYVGNANKNILVCLQIETADSIKNIDEIAAVKGVDLLFLGQNDLCMSMGLYEKYQFPDMYTSKELNDATQKMIDACKKYDRILGIFLFGTDRVAEFIKKGYRFISVGNDLHHLVTQAATHVKALEAISEKDDKAWKRQKTALF
jgi:4-hydroxy-2-oxoheptanedioate aldolase